MIGTPTRRWPPKGQLTTPNEIAESMTRRPHVTYSEIRAFQSCPLKWRYQYVDKAEPEQLSAAMLLGSGIHAAVELHFEAILAAAQRPTIDQMMESFRECWDSEKDRAPIQYSRGQDEETTAATARRMLEEFVGSSLAEPGGEIIGVEESFKVHLADDLPSLAGRVDMITHDRETNDLTITDFKTARSVWSQTNANEQSDQLILYAQGCRAIADELNANLKLRYVIVTKTKQPRVDAITVPFDTTRIDRSRAIIRRVFQAMQSGVTYPVPSPMNCTGCSFRGQCNKW